jgi:hypothetical protein
MIKATLYMDDGGVSIQGHYYTRPRTGRPFRFFAGDHALTYHPRGVLHRNGDRTSFRTEEGFRMELVDREK